MSDGSGALDRHNLVNVACSDSNNCSIRGESDVKICLQTCISFNQ
jgi:hypothetical protein